MTDLPFVEPLTRSNTNAHRHAHASPSSASDQPQLLSRTEAADYLGVKPQTLAAWACSKRVQVPYTKLGRRVMYRRTDLEALVAANLRTSTQGEQA